MIGGAVDEGNGPTVLALRIATPSAQKEVMTDEELVELRAQAADGDLNAVAQLVELAGERGDLDELRRLAADGNTDAVDLLVELAGEREDLDELRRLAASGSTDAADILAELTDDEDDGDEEEDGE